MSVLTKGKTLGDMVKWLMHEGFNLASGTFRNTSGATITLVQILGQPVKVSGGKYVPVLATDEANATGICLHDEKVTLANNTDLATPVPILVRGPAIINKDALPTEDVAGTDFTVATLVTAYATKNIIAQTEPTTKETQTT